MHTSFSKGTTVYLIFKDGRTAIDKFEDHKSGTVILRMLGRVNISELRYIGINKLKTDN